MSVAIATIAVRWFAEGPNPTVFSPENREGANRDFPIHLVVSKSENPAVSMKNNPFTGMNYLLRGLKMLLLPGLKRYLMVPITVNVVVFSLIAWVGYQQFASLLQQFLPESGWLHYLRWVLWPLFALAFLLIVFYTFTAIANLIAAPFNGILAARVERELTGRAPPEPPGKLLSQILPSLLSELRKLIYFLIRAVPLLILFLIPVAQLAAPLLWLMFGAWFLALEYLDYPMGNHGLDFKQQLTQLRSMRLTTLGFGAALVVLMLIPGLNLVAMPAAVAGSTILWCERDKLGSVHSHPTEPHS